jgi:hypothetical protein
MPKIVRLTLLKITDTEAIQLAIQKYSTLAQDAKKVRARACFTPHSRFLYRAYPFKVHSAHLLHPICTSRTCSLVTTSLSTPIGLGPWRQRYIDSRRELRRIIRVTDYVCVGE